MEQTNIFSEQEGGHSRMYGRRDELGPRASIHLKAVLWTTSASRHFRSWRPTSLYSCTLAGHVGNARTSSLAFLLSETDLTYLCFLPVFSFQHSEQHSHCTQPMNTSHSPHRTRKVPMFSGVQGVLHLFLFSFPSQRLDPMDLHD